MRIMPFLFVFAAIGGCTHHAAEQSQAEPVPTVDSNRDIVAERLAERAKAEQNLREAQDRVGKAPEAANPLPPGVRRIKDAWDPPSLAAYWELSQITDNYAVFAYMHENGRDYVVAVERTGLAGVNLQPGLWLQKAVDCVQWQRDETWKNDRGFDIRAKIYCALPCP